MGAKKGTIPKSVENRKRWRTVALFLFGIMWKANVDNRGKLKSGPAKGKKASKRDMCIYMAEHMKEFRKVKNFIKNLFGMGWYKPHSTWNKPKEPGLTDKCIFCSHHKPIKRTDFVLEFSEHERITGSICVDCYLANARQFFV